MCAGDALSERRADPSPLERGIGEGENPVSGLLSESSYDARSESRVAWECSAKREVHVFQS